MNQNELISCCGSDCGACYCYGKMCKGCNALSGKVFHAPEGKACPIYDCCRNAEGTTEGRLSLRNDDRSDTWLDKFIIAFGRQLGTMYRVACFDMPSQSVEL